MSVRRGRAWGAIAATTVLTAGVVPGGVTLARAASQRTATAAAADVLGAADAAAVNAVVAWKPCTSGALKSAGAVCGTITVPMNYRSPQGAKVHLAVAMVRHKVPAAKYQGVMLVNPGGPGGSGLVFATFGSFVPNHVGDAYDWIGFDPRGVGASTPAVSCDPNYAAGPRPPYLPSTAAIVKTWLAKAKAYAAACKAHTGATLLANLKTMDVVRDMDRIRIALGQKRINYYGFSYGTYLGQVYATNYPSRVRRFVLDANVDPRKVWYNANLDQDVAFEKVMKLFFAWIAKYDRVYHLGATGAVVEKNFYAERDRLAKAPAGGVVGGSEWTDIFLTAGYSQAAWEGLASLWATYESAHGAQPLVDEYAASAGVGDDNGYAIYNAVQCTDTQWPTRWAQWQRDNTRVNRAAPYETWANAWYNAPCLYWPAKAGTRPVVNGAAAPPMLLLSETLDAATPFTGSLEVRRRFPRAVLIATRGGTTHANSLNGLACVDTRVAAYLATGRLPKRLAGHGADVTCTAAPQPVPTSVQSPAAARAALLAPPVRPAAGPAVPRW